MTSNDELNLLLANKIINPSNFHPILNLFLYLIYAFFRRKNLWLLDIITYQLKFSLSTENKSNVLITFILVTTVSRTSCESMGRFYCDDGLCIEQSLRCDGIQDCHNGTDEQNCGKT